MILCVQKKKNKKIFAIMIFFLLLDINNKMFVKITSLKSFLVLIWFIFVVEIILSVPLLDENVLTKFQIVNQNETTHDNVTLNNSTLFSIIVPTYKEAENIEVLLEELRIALNDHNILDQTEIIIVDDNSQDGTEENIRKFNNKFPNVIVRLIVRTVERGLSSAVVRGFSEANGYYLLCMDADLQHPPSSTPKILLSLKKNNCDFAIGTRYPSKKTLEEFGMNDDTLLVSNNWGQIRKTISWGARTLAQPLISSDSYLTDPMSGFFALTKNSFARAEKIGINMIGFKISLELFVKGNIKNHCEIPFEFGVRKIGASKLSSKVIIYYIFHLISLYSFRFPFIWATLVQSFIALSFLFLISILVIKYYIKKKSRERKRKFYVSYK